MQYRGSHEPKLRDMSDYHKPLSKRKLRIIMVSFVVAAFIWAMFQGSYLIVASH